MLEDHVISAADGQIGRFYKPDKGHQVLFESIPFSKRQVSDVGSGESKECLGAECGKGEAP